MISVPRGEGEDEKTNKGRKGIDSRRRERRHSLFFVVTGVNSLAMTCSLLFSDVYSVAR